MTAGSGSAIHLDERGGARFARMARLRQLTLARPPGSLGELDAIYLKVAAIRADAAPGPLPAAVSVLAGDHGVAAHGISAYRADVTARVARLIVAGRAPVNLLAASARAQVHLADFGLAEPVGPQRFKVGAGTGDISRADAMSAEQAAIAIANGRAHADALADAGLLAVGEIGVGNTTATAALAARLLGCSPEVTVGPGTGVGPAELAAKRSLVEAALRRTAGVPDDPVRLLGALGGFEIAGNVGVILGAAEHGTLVILDGYITGVAALIAARLCPAVTSFLVAAHRSREPGHSAVLESLHLRPLIDAGLHLGMATGAALALPMINAALAVGRDTPSALDAGLAGRRSPPSRPAGPGCGPLPQPVLPAQERRDRHDDSVG
jgi:nicotinate-nucleotide--dimethylbenzimidazole phosphoribosyltransferase